MLKTRREPCQPRSPGISAKTDTTNGTGRSSSDPRHSSLGEPDADTDLFHDGFRKHEGLAIALGSQYEGVFVSRFEVSFRYAVVALADAIEHAHVDARTGRDEVVRCL